MFTPKPSVPLFLPARMKSRLSREHHKQLPTGKAPIYLRLSYLRQVTYIATGVYLLAGEWDQKSQAVRGREEEHDTARATLRVWLGDAERIASEQRKTPHMTVAKYKALVLGKEDRPLSLLAVAEAFYQNKARPEMRKSFATLRGYRSRRLALETYLSSIKELQLPAGAVNLAWLRRYERWCISSQQLAVSTARKYVSLVSELIDFAAHEQWLPLNPVAGYRFEVEAPPTDPLYLPEADVQALASAVLPRILDRARQAWLFCCYTGLSYVDYARFEPAAHLFTDASGRRWIRLERQKTGARVSIPLLPEAEALLAGGQSIPKLEASYLNRRLKHISQALGLSLPLTCGLARHTASHRLRNHLGFTDEEAAAILGHSKDIMNSNYSRKREEGLSLALNRIGLTAPAPTLRQQLEAALAVTQLPELRDKLLALLKELPD